MPGADVFGVLKRAGFLVSLVIAAVGWISVVQILVPQLKAQSEQVEDTEPLWELMPMHKKVDDFPEGNVKTFEKRNKNMVEQGLEPRAQNLYGCAGGLEGPLNDCGRHLTRQVKKRLDLGIGCCQ